MTHPIHIFIISQTLLLDNTKGLNIWINIFWPFHFWCVCVFLIEEQCRSVWLHFTQPPTTTTTVWRRAVPNQSRGCLSFKCRLQKRKKLIPPFKALLSTCSKAKTGESFLDDFFFNWRELYSYLYSFLHSTHRLQNWIPWMQPWRSRRTRTTPPKCRMTPGECPSHGRKRERKKK